MEPSSMVELPAYEYAPRWVPLAELGFNIRGGKEHFCGIFLSKVMPNTEAERLGLQEADQIVSVNETNFEDIEHAKAVKILKSNTEIVMQLRYFPYGYRKTYEKVQNSNTGIGAASS
ncbi:PDZ domain-containing protein 11-like isoform X2 [Homarus americanus]|uniref:PDZ domain-containing protein 11-like isoform X2 n=1 Tax=Homarus americanus TaxID=6706 RepID=UPI001C445162|nr:PDZ domain-containing protein 11-like isoform X2 [Homarus americanus]XP_042241328.1 PDZ domain-containing protein 11-like isoform X2 [Homarus americanus]XP_042241329.1 PDZ domain-containing protein 11-like isoform X2 [Homarus americanus]